MAMIQKEAVFQAVCNVTGFTGEGKVEISSEQRAQVNAILFEGVKAGTIKCDKDYTDAQLKIYVSGLQSNWLRKDKRLNGGVKYEAKNPGSRAGQGDEMMRNLKILIADPRLSDEDKAEIQVHIDKRQAELNAVKTHKAVDISALPEELRSKFTVVK